MAQRWAERSTWRPRPSLLPDRCALCASLRQFLAAFRFTVTFCLTGGEMKRTASETRRMGWSRGGCQEASWPLLHPFSRPSLPRVFALPSIDRTPTEARVPSDPKDSAPSPHGECTDPRQNPCQERPCRTEVDILYHPRQALHSPYLPASTPRHTQVTLDWNVPVGYTMARPNAL